MPKLSTAEPKPRSRKPRTKKADAISKATNTAQKRVSSRKVVHSELKGKVGWLTADQAKTFLGWKQSDGEKPFTDFLFKDRNGIPTQCHHVAKQRPFYDGLAKQHMTEILGGHWNGDGGESNGESMIVGQTGIIIDGQHRMVGLVWAEQEWLKHPDKYPYWQEEPKIHCFINLGVREDMVSINTINTGKPRSLGDAIYSSGLFGFIDGVSSKEKNKLKTLAKMTDHAVRLLWQRTGAKKDAFAPKRTHAESLDFIQRHPKLLEAVRHVYEEDGKDHKLKYYPSPGYAAALLYLMASCKTERENDEGTGYVQVPCPTEDLLDWSMWQKACDFWTLLAAGDKGFDNVRNSISEYVDAEGGSFLQERIAILIKSWWQFSHDEKITASSIALDLVMNNDGIQVLEQVPLVGEVFGEVAGIDIGEPTD